MQRKTTPSRDSESPKQHDAHRESDHNKHNDEGQTGHKPQEHSPAEEKR
jgi:hypothetical protein